MAIKTLLFLAVALCCVGCFGGDELDEQAAILLVQDSLEGKAASGSECRAYVFVQTSEWRAGEIRSIPLRDSNQEADRWWRVWAIRVREDEDPWTWRITDDQEVLAEHAPC